MDQPKPVVVVMSVVALAFIVAGFVVGFLAETEAMEQQHMAQVAHPASN